MNDDTRGAPEGETKASLRTISANGDGQTAPTEPVAVASVEW